MKTTKAKILDQLLSLQSGTIRDLSEILGLSGISVRQHLIHLEAEGLVCSSEFRHGVGRPRFVYSLTDKGYDAASASQLGLIIQAFSTMKHQLKDEALLDLLRQIGKDLAAGFQYSADSSPIDFLPQVIAHLKQYGYFWSWEQKDNLCTLSSRHCPFLKVGHIHPEVCAITLALLESLFQTPVTNNACEYNGDPACTYTLEVQ